MKKGGVGGANTLTGLAFENKASLSDIFSKTPGYSVDGKVVYYKKKKVAEMYPKHRLYDFLLTHHIDHSKIMSKKLLPDDALFVLHNKTFFIMEIKFQETEGSVDEKLQTCDFKNKQYAKLFSRLRIKTKFVYVLNNWFKQARYKDTLDYIPSVKCFYFFNRVPFKFFGLPVPKASKKPNLVI